jgi:hypothetical protein
LKRERDAVLKAQGLLQAEMTNDDKEEKQAFVTARTELANKFRTYEEKFNTWSEADRHLHWLEVDAADIEAGHMEADDTLEGRTETARKDLGKALRARDRALTQVENIRDNDDYKNAKAKWEPKMDAAEEAILDRARAALYGADAVEAKDAVPAKDKNPEIPAVEARAAVVGATAKLGSARNAWAQAALLVSTAEG